jgi:hypothetical protein
MVLTKFGYSGVRKDQREGDDCQTRINHFCDLPVAA